MRGAGQNGLQFTTGAVGSHKTKTFCERSTLGRPVGKPQLVTRVGSRREKPNMGLCEGFVKDAGQERYFGRALTVIDYDRSQPERPPLFQKDAI